MRQAAGDALAGEAVREPVLKLPASRRMLMRNWRPPADASPEQLESLDRERVRRALLQEWPARPLGALGGKTPGQAGADAQCGSSCWLRSRCWPFGMKAQEDEFDFDELRRQLGLPTPTPIVLDENAMGMLPPTRLERVNVAKLNDKDLESGFHRAAIFAVRNALAPLRRGELSTATAWPGKASNGKPTSGSRTARSFSRSVGVRRARPPGGPVLGQDVARGTCSKCRFCIGLRDGEAVTRLVQHIDKQHKREPEAIQACIHMLMEAGLIRPDGTPVQADEELPPAAGESPAAEPGKLWTPDSNQPATAGKIWTPD